jgi:hydrogenase maturation protease
MANQVSRLSLGDAQGFDHTSALRMTSVESKAPHGVLVIGYGNTLRGDDGVGPAVAEAIAALDLPGVRTLACPLLTPELAEPISQARGVVFVDAAVDAPREVQRRPLAPADTSQVMAHAASPATLLALARDVFGQAPQACLITIPVEDLGIGDELSPLAQRGFERAVQEVKIWAAQALVAR